MKHRHPKQMDRSNLEEREFKSTTRGRWPMEFQVLGLLMGVGGWVGLESMPWGPLHLVSTRD